MNLLNMLKENEKQIQKLEMKLIRATIFRVRPEDDETSNYLHRYDMMKSVYFSKRLKIK